MIETKATLAVKQRAGGRPSTAAMNGGGAQQWPEGCPVSELRVPECSCPRCYEQVMKPKVKAGLTLQAGRARLLGLSRGAEARVDRVARARRRRGRKVLLGACATTAAMLGAPSGASGAVGDLTYKDCISGETESGACTQVGSATPGGAYSGLNYLLSVTVSSDGTSLYVASRYDSAVARFDRDPSTGALTYQGCTTGDTETGKYGSGACGEIESATDEGTSSGLDSLRAVTLSPDGKWLYVASGSDDAVARFERNPANGALTYRDCITGRIESGPEPAGTGACAAIPNATSGGGGSGLNNLQALLVSADGESLYAASFGDDAVAHFDRDPNTGALTYGDCISGETESAGTCTQVASAEPDGANSGLDRPHSLALSPNDESLYAASQRDDAVARFGRDPTTGALSYEDCVSGETESAGACTQIASAEPAGANSGLDNPFSVKVGPEGRSLYVAARDDAAVARFDRDPSSGALTYRGCITGETDSGGCAPIGTATADGWSSGLDSVRSLSLTADGRSLYSASRGDDAVAHFERDPTSGALTYRDCLTSAADRVGSGGTGACEPIANATSNGADSGLDSLFELTVSPDDKSLYVASRYDAAVASFDRETPGEPGGPPAPDPPSPGPPLPGSASLDLDAPSAQVSAKGKPKAGKAIKIKVGSNEAVTATATGKVTAKGGEARSLSGVAAKKKRANFKLKKASKQLPASGTATLKLKQKGKKSKRKLVKLVKRGAKAKAKIKVTLTDLAGNSTNEKLVVKLKK